MHLTKQVAVWSFAPVWLAVAIITVAWVSLPYSCCCSRLCRRTLIPRLLLWPLLQGNPCPKAGLISPCRYVSSCSRHVALTAADCFVCVRRKACDAGGSNLRVDVNNM